MNKYELALVVNAKIEDDARTATVEKAKEIIDALVQMGFEKNDVDVQIIERNPIG